MRRIVLLTCSFILVLFEECGQPSEVLVATTVAQTADEATLTLAAMPVDKLTPTFTLAPTDTPPPTSTPTTAPEPDAKAILAWRELDFSEKFIAFPPDAIGIDEGVNCDRWLMFHFMKVDSVAAGMPLSRADLISV